MITLITGQPGAGKTLLLVHEFLTEAKEKSRPIVADGIPDLVIEHTPAPTVPEWTHYVEDAASQDGRKLLFTFPQGSLVVIDECQRVFRPRGVSKGVPPEVAAFETHRHQGLDFILITQHPGLLDSNVRRLVGRHLHIRDLGILGRKVYEWPEATDPEKFRSAPVQRGWKLPKKSFDLYKSSSLHIKPKRGIPKGIAVLAVTVPLLLGGGYYAYQSIQKKVAPPAPQASADTAKPGTTETVAQAPQVITDPATMLIEFDPVIPGRPETAPAYNDLRVVKNMPVVVGCIKTPTRCTCQNQQGIDAGLDRLQCEAWIEKPRFDAYREPVLAETKAPSEKQPNPRQTDNQPQNPPLAALAPDLPPKMAL